MLTRCSRANVVIPRRIILLLILAKVTGKAIHKTSYDNLTVTIWAGVPYLHKASLKSTNPYWDKVPLPPKAIVIIS